MIFIRKNLSTSYLAIWRYLKCVRQQSGDYYSEIGTKGFRRINSRQLEFDKLIKNIIAKGLRMYGWVFRTFRSRSTSLMLTLLKTLIRCQVEYACVIWNPIRQSQIDLLESVQRRFTSKFDCFPRCDDALQMVVCGVDFPTWLSRFKFYSLQRR